jgi:hypothetical protein
MNTPTGANNGRLIYARNGSQEVMQQQAERYLSLLDAIEECVERGVSMKAINTLIFETGADVSDVGHICNKFNLIRVIK